MRARADDGRTLAHSKEKFAAHRLAHRTRARRAHRSSTHAGRLPDARCWISGPKPAPRKFHASEGVRLAQHAAATNLSAPNASPSASSSQDLDITAPIIDFFVADGRRLDRAQTSGAAQITISPAQILIPQARNSAQRTVITAGRFNAKICRRPPNAQSRLTFSPRRARCEKSSASPPACPTV